MQEAVEAEMPLIALRLEIGPETAVRWSGLMELTNQLNSLTHESNARCLGVQAGAHRTSNSTSERDAKQLNRASGDLRIPFYRRDRVCGGCTLGTARPTMRSLTRR